MTTAKVQATATIKFLSDGSIDLNLTSIEGITAKKVDLVSMLLWRKVNEMRAKARHEDAARQSAIKAVNAAKAAKAETSLTEKVNA